MRTTSLLLSLALLLSACSGSTPVIAGTTTIRLSASPSTIYADSKSLCTVSAEVRDSSGDLAADGLQVRFSSSLGVIDTTASTVAGVARAILRSGPQPGQAMVTAVLVDGQAISQIQVALVPPGTAIEADAFISVSAKDYLAYSADAHTVDSAGGGSVDYRGLAIDADSMQIDVSSNKLKAKGRTGGDPVRISRGSKTITAKLLAYDLAGQRGLILTEGDDGKLQRLQLNGVDLTTTPADQPGDQTAFDFVDLSESTMIVKAKSITVRPRRDIHFRRAEVFVAGERLIKLPLYVLPMSVQGVGGLKYVGLSSSGVRVDVPIYLSLTPTGTGSVRIRNQQGGWSSHSTLPGWAVDLQEDYATGNSEGKFTVAQVNRKDWGLDWEHSQAIGDAKMHSYIAMPAHRDLYGMVSFNKPLRSAYLGVNLRGQKPRAGSASSTADVYLQTKTRALAKALKYSVTLHSSVSNSFQQGYGMANGLQLQMFSTPLTFGRGTSLSNSLSLGQDWGGFRSGFSMYASSMLSTSFGKSSSLNLGYTYTLDPGFLSDYGRHRVTAYLMTFGGKWRAMLNGVYTLDYPTTSAYASVGYQLRPDWRLDLRGTYQKFDTIGFGDMEIGVARQLGTQEVGLSWSQSLRKVRVEIGAMQF